LTPGLNPADSFALLTFLLHHYSMSGEFSTGAPEAIVHYLAQKKYHAQVLSMLTLFEEHDCQIEEGTGLAWRVTFSAAFDCLEKVSGPDDMKQIIYSLDSMEHKLVSDEWSSMRPTAIAYYAVAILGEKVRSCRVTRPGITGSL
jgi:hypothetical protein